MSILRSAQRLVRRFARDEAGILTAGTVLFGVLTYYGTTGAIDTATTAGELTLNQQRVEAASTELYNVSLHLQAQSEATDDPVESARLAHLAEVARESSAKLVNVVIPMIEEAKTKHGRNATVGGILSALGGPVGKVKQAISVGGTVAGQLTSVDVPGRNAGDSITAMFATLEGTPLGQMSEEFQNTLPGRAAQLVLQRAIKECGLHEGNYRWSEKRGCVSERLIALRSRFNGQLGNASQSSAEYTALQGVIDTLSNTIKNVDSEIAEQFGVPTGQYTGSFGAPSNMEGGALVTNRIVLDVTESHVTGKMIYEYQIPDFMGSGTWCFGVSVDIPPSTLYVSKDEDTGTVTFKGSTAALAGGQPGGCTGSITAIETKTVQIDGTIMPESISGTVRGDEVVGFTATKGGG